MKQGLTIAFLLFFSFSFSQEIFRDDFKNNSNNWYEGDHENGEYSTYIRNGKYVIDQKAEDAQWFFWKTVDFDRNKNFEISANITQVSGVTNHGSGLIWGAKDIDNTYCFIASSGGSYFIYKYVNGQYISVKQWTEAESAINPQGFNNKFSIRQIGDMWSFYINDNLMHTMEADTWMGEKLGFVVNYKMLIEVEDLVVNEVQDNSTLYSKLFNKSNTVFLEEFNDNSYNWDTYNDEDTDRKIKGGNYVIEHKREEKGWLFYKDIAFDPLLDFEIETTLRQVSGVDNYGHGLVWGTQNGKNSFSFVISSNGYYKIYKYEMNYSTEESEYTELLEWTKAKDIINPMGTQNKLSIKKDGDLLKFFINEEFVHELEFMNFLGPKIGWDLSRNMVVEIDKVVIRQNAGNVFESLPQIYSEEFSDNNREWPEGETEESSSYVRNGKFVIEHKREDGSWHWWDHGIDLQDNKNFEIEMAVKHIGGVDNYGFGFTYGMKDTDNYYGFNVSGNGYYQIYEYRNDNYLDLRDWTYVPQIVNLAGNQNILKIRKEGNLVHYFINDKYVSHTPFSGVFGDRVGFRLFKNMQVEVDYIRVRQGREIISSVTTSIQTNNINQTNNIISRPPVISWVLPDGPVITTNTKSYSINAKINSDQPLVNVTLLLNNSVIQSPEATGMVGRKGNNSFYSNLSLFPGSNDIKIIVANEAGSVTSQSRTIIYSQPQPPIISWLNPVQAFSVSSLNKITIKAGINTSSQLGNINVLINDQPLNNNRGLSVTSDQNNSSYQKMVEESITLSPGDNEIKIIAENTNGSKATEVRTISYNPQFTQNNPDVTDQQQILVSGRTDYAILFATDEYDNWGNLVNPVNDAETIGEELREGYGFQVELVKNATTSEVMRTLRKYATKSYLDKDQLFIFFAGHGSFDDAFGEGYLVCKNSLMDDEAKTSYLSHSTLRTVINNIPSMHTFVAMDVCFGGTFDQLTARADSRGGDNVYRELTSIELINRKLKHKTRRYLTSGGKEYVPDGRPGHHSPFARKLLEALRSYGGNDNMLTLNEVVSYLERVNPQPRYGEFGDNEPGSDFLFIAR